MRPKRIAPAAKISWKQRFIASLLLMLSLFLVFDPLWECHDHLDNLRHFGPHGALLFALIVACTGILLLKSKNGLGKLLLSLIANILHPFEATRSVSRSISSLALAALLPPLRI